MLILISCLYDHAELKKYTDIGCDVQCSTGGVVLPGRLLGDE